MDYNLSQDYHDPTNIELKDKPNKWIYFIGRSQILMKKIKETTDYNDAVIYAVERLVLNPFFAGDNYQILKSKNIKIIFYLMTSMLFQLFVGCKFGRHFDLNIPKLTSRMHG